MGAVRAAAPPVTVNAAPAAAQGTAASLPEPRVRARTLGVAPMVVGLTVVDDTTHFLVVSANGLGKRTPFEDYPTKGRGGKGVITMRVTEKTGPVTAAIRVAETDELMLMTNTGQSVRIRVADIRITGRNASGVKLMNLKTGEVIQDIALVVNDDEDEIEVASLPETDPSEVEEEIIDDIEEEEDDDIEGDEEESDEEEK
jgi:DNA gyrase subunit A